MADVETPNSRATSASGTPRSLTNSVAILDRTHGSRRSPSQAEYISRSKLFQNKSSYTRIIPLKQYRPF